MVNVERYNVDLARLLLDTYIKVLCVDLSNDRFDEIKLDDAELDERQGFSSKISEWLHGFALSGNVFEEDLQNYLEFTRFDRLVEVFRAGQGRESLTYRRRNDEGDFRWVKMNLRKTASFTQDEMVILLYIEDIHDEVMAIQQISSQKEEISHQAQALSDQAQTLSDQAQTLSDQRQTISDQNQALIDQRQEISDQAQTLSDQRLELTHQAEEISSQRETLSSQKQEISTQKDITEALVDAYFTCLFVDLNDNSYRRIHVDDAFIAHVPETGSMFDAMQVFMDELVVPVDAQAFNDNFSVEAIRQNLVSQNSYDYEYEAHIADDDMWCRIAAILVDNNEDGSPRHVVLAMQDVTTQAENTAHTNAMLKDAFSAAVAASSAKSEFMSRMSHDIRTPLNGIIGMTAIAGVHLDDRERVADCLTKITGAGKHLLSLINDILDLSKIESGKVSLTDSEFNLPALLDDLLNMVHTAIEERNHELNVYIENVTHEDVVGDDIRLQQVFTNILSNAIKYTPNGGSISIYFSELPSGSANIGRYRFICEDNGYGMSEEFLEKLFDPFERADGTPTGKIQGTGLGMTIARNIINMMGGSISVESKENVGTRFTVDFKIKLQEKPELITQELLNLPVLVVDDDEVTCESACITLTELGMVGEYTLTGEEAIEKVRTAHEAENDYFACLIDWKMPGLDGIETTRRIRQLVGPDALIIIISAYEWNDIEDEARLAGADGFITKPLFKSRLRAAFTEIPKTLKSAEGIHMLDEFGAKDYSNKRLLLVEDNDLNREIAREIILMTGAHVECAEDGKMATEMFAKSKPGYYDMVFMDVRMPVMDGYEATRVIRAMERDDAQTVPIIALTANAFVEDMEQAHDAGMNEHMAKPIDLDKLLEVMDRYLAVLV